MLNSSSYSFCSECQIRKWLELKQLINLRDSKLPELIVPRHEYLAFLINSHRVFLSTTYSLESRQRCMFMVHQLRSENGLLGAYSKSSIVTLAPSE
jgi:hypothetical protein